MIFHRAAVQLALIQPVHIIESDAVLRTALPQGLIDRFGITNALCQNEQIDFPGKQFILRKDRQAAELRALYGLTAHYAYKTASLAKARYDFTGVFPRAMKDNTPPQKRLKVPFKVGQDIGKLGHRSSFRMGNTSPRT